MNFGELKTLVAFYLHRDDLVNFMDGFADLAAERIGKQAELRVMEKAISHTGSDGSEDLPLDFQSMKNIAASGTRGLNPLQFTSKAQFDLIARATSQSSSGQATHYTIDNSLILITPAATDWNYVYYQRPEPMVDPADQNAVLAKYPSLYLFAMLAYASNSIQDIDLEQVYLDRFQSELDLANDADRLSGLSDTPPEMRIA